MGEMGCGKIHNFGCTSSCHLAQGEQVAGWLVISCFHQQCQVGAAQKDSTCPIGFERKTSWQLIRDFNSQPSPQLGDNWWLFKDLLDWELPLSQPLVDVDQPLTSRRRARDEIGPSEHRVQPHAEAENQDLFVPVLLLDKKAMVIVLESKAALSRSYQIVFEGCFENTSEGSTVTCISSEVGHRLWLQQ